MQRGWTGALLFSNPLFFRELSVEFPDIQQEKEKLTKRLSRRDGVAADLIRVVASPYRICPLGAHIDHQGGSVLGMTINAYTLMAYYLSADECTRLGSANYPGEVRFDLLDIGESTGSFWGAYPRAAALALQEEHELTTGVVGIVDGMLPGGGLSSSASVLLAYLHAFAEANALRLSQWDYVHLTHTAEKKYIGLNNGILDQASIVFGKQHNLLHIDTKDKKVRYLPDRLGEDHYRIVVAFSGYSRELTTSGYNSRVEECLMAAKQLSQMAGKNPAALLSDVPLEEYQRYREKLEAPLARRSEHYFSETQRVVNGVSAWEAGGIDQFGSLMNASCKSSIENYQCGVQAICDLQQIVSSTEGVMGSRFMGGGFGGCVVGFVQPAHAAAAVDNIQTSYRKVHPEVGEQSRTYLAKSDDGVRFI